jgi:SOS-response transcriptional repressor LexA
VRDKKDLLLIASNRNYPPIQFFENRWISVGVVVHVVRDMGKRYSGTETE